MPDHKQRGEQAGRFQESFRIMLGITAVLLLLLNALFRPESPQLKVGPRGIFTQGGFEIDPIHNYFLQLMGCLGALGFLALESMHYRSDQRLLWWGTQLVIGSAVFCLSFAVVFYLILISSGVISYFSPAFFGACVVLIYSYRLSARAELLQSGTDIPTKWVNFFVFSLGLMVIPLLVPAAIGAVKNRTMYILNEAALGHPSHLGVLVALGGHANTVHTIPIAFVGDYRTTPLLEAIKRGNAETAEFLLGHGADVNLAGDSDAVITTGTQAQMLETPLMSAAEKDNSTIVKMLITRGAHVNARGSGGVTPLMLAVDHSGTDVVQQLILAGADINAKDSNGNSPLKRARVQGRVEMVTLLGKAGARE